MRKIPQDLGDGKGKGLWEGGAAHANLERGQSTGQVDEVERTVEWGMGLERARQGGAGRSVS